MSLNLTRADAARVAANVELRDVRLWGVRADLETVPDEDENRLSYRFDSDVQIQYSKDHPFLIVLGDFNLELQAVPLVDSDEPENSQDAGDAKDKEDEEGGQPETVASLSFHLNALFQIEVEPEGSFTEAELTAFGETTGQFALYPYAREFVADMTGRMGLSPLHLGVMRLNLENRDAAEAES